MARVARVVAPGIPHHITQRGNRRQLTFFCEEDYRLYKALIGQWCQFHGVEILAYCLMPNHVHLIAVPKENMSLRLAIGEAHRRYTGKINKRQGWTGHLWQGRFYSNPMDESHLIQVLRYVLLNPVRAGLCQKPEEYAWSSAKAMATGSRDPLVTGHDRIRQIEDWNSFISLIPGEDDSTKIRNHLKTGRPLGNDHFIDRLEYDLGRKLRYKKRGRPKGKSFQTAIRNITHS